MSHTSKSQFYGSIDDADRYFDEQLFAADWTGASTANKQNALIQATRAIDSLRFKDYKWAVHVVLRDTTSPTDKQLEDAYESEIHQWPRGNGDSTNPTTLDPETWLIEVDGSSGTYTLTFDGEETANIAFDATASAVQTALEALTALSSGDITVEDDTEHGTTFLVTLTSTGSFNGSAYDSLTIDGTNLNGSTVSRVLTLEDNLPERIRWATFEEAISLLSGKNPQQEWENAVMTSDGVSSTRVSSDRAQLAPAHTRHFITSPTAWKYLSPYLDPGESNSFKFQRK